MALLSKIEYYDLKLEAKANRLPKIFGRNEEVIRLQRILLKQIGGHALVIAPSGAGKTSFLLGFAKETTEIAGLPRKIVQLQTHSLQHIGQLPLASLNFYQDALNSITDTIIIIDDFGELLATGPQAVQNWTSFLHFLMTRKDLRIILSMRPEESEKLLREIPGLKDSFSAIKLAPQPQQEQLEILKHASQTLIGNNPFHIEPGAYTIIFQLIQRFPSLGNLPKAGINILDEAIAEARSHKQNTITPKAFTQVNSETIEMVISQKLNIPLKKLGTNEKDQLKNLHTDLSKRVVGQSQALATISSVIQRAKLGLRAQNRPLGSFLALGPSGVGKTETAKVLSETLYGKYESFLRIDMSEFSESHSVARLVGSPPGYIGFESGGQITNHLQKEPYSLILLDEIEKAHPKIFDIFLQLLDDGRLTSGQGETVDATQSIIIATSNLGVPEILDAYQKNLDLNDQNTIKNIVFPVLLNFFRMEFLNRFDAIIVFKPLTTEDLTNIALLEIQKIEKRTASHNIKFRIERSVLGEKVAQLADPRFGARPIKRYIEELCEGLITEQLLK